MARRIQLVGSALIVLSFVYTTASAQMLRIPLSREQLILLSKDPILGQRPDLIRREWIIPHKIGFLPTAAVRRELEEAGVSPLITAILPRHFGSTLWLKIFEYECLGCEADARAGWEFAQQVSNAEDSVKLRREFDPTLRALFGAKSYDPFVERMTPGWQPPLNQQPMVYVHGTLEKDGQTYRVTSRISYRSLTDAGPVGSNLTRVVPGDALAFRAAAEETATWVIDTLRTAIQ
jgi:hypothetical protein